MIKIDELDMSQILKAFQGTSVLQNYEGHRGSVIEAGSSSSHPALLAALEADVLPAAGHR